jgi:Uma2 family endonuclease
MASAIEQTAAEWTVADLLDRFGPIALRRIWQDPAPGSATELEVIDIRDREKRLVELVDGVLVEKVMGAQEAYLTCLLIELLGAFVRQRKLGFVFGPDGAARLAPGLVRIPDVSFFAWEQFPDRKVPRVPMVQVAPLLAVEVLSPSNTPKEMERKLHDYFEAGVKLVWYMDPVPRTVRVFTAPEESQLLREDETLQGGTVLPGFILPLKELFGELGS